MKFKSKIVIAAVLASSLVLTSIGFAAVKTPSLLYAYRYEGNANDWSGSANNGTVTGASLTTGKFGQGYSFTAASSNKITTASSPGFGTGDFTICVWLNFTTSQSNAWIAGYFSGSIIYALIVDPDSAGNNPLGLYFRDSNGVHTDSGTHQTSGSGYNDGAWHFLCGVRSGNNSLLYIDAALKVTRTPNFSGNFSGGAIYYGCVNNSGSASNFYDGKLDEVNVFTKALSASEIRSLHLNYHPSEF